MATTKALVKSPSRPPTRDRSTHCTHLQLTRLYDDFGCVKCSICHRRPQLGWLYRCTQDHDGFLPISDFSEVEDIKRFDHDAQLYTLSASIVETAARGLYSDEQLDILWKQKIEVRKTIRQVRPNTSATTSTASSSQYSLHASTTTSTLLSSSDETEGTELSYHGDYSQSGRSPLEPIHEVHDDLENDRRRILPSTKSVLPTPCTFRVCHACRPIYRERAWQSIDSVLKTPYRPTPKHEIKNRRIANANVVKQLGLNTCYSRVHEQQLYEETNQSKRNSRTQFQGIVQHLLRDREASHDVDRQSTTLDEHGYELKRITTSRSLNGPNLGHSSTDNISEDAIHKDPNSARPLYRRRGLQLLSPIQPLRPPAISEHDEAVPSPGLPTGQTNASCPAVLGLKIDINKANRGQELYPPLQKTPTESIKDSLYRLGALKKSSSRFIID